MSRSLTAWSCQVSLVERSHSSFALYLFMCRFLSLLSSDADDGCRWKSRLLVLNSVLEPVAGVELTKETFIFRAR
jgi:hypothetical protein